MLLFPVGSSGDVHPFVGLALALKARGHQVTLAVNGYFRALVEKVGLEAVEHGSKDEYVEVTKHPDLWHPLRSFRFLFNHGIAPAMRPQYELVAEKMRSGPLVVVNSCLGFGARIAHEKLCVPLVTVHCQPAVIWSEYESPALAGMNPHMPRLWKRFQYLLGESLFIDRTVRAETNRFRTELGLPPMKRTTRWWHSPNCTLGLFPEWYAPIQPDWPAHFYHTEFPLWDENLVSVPDAELERFLTAGPPPVVFTPGSGNQQAAEFFREALAACRLLGRRGLFLTRFRAQIPSALPDSVRHFDYVPFSQVLPRAAALIHHGGIGTASQGLRAGIPQLIMPLAHDQPDNLARLERLGVGTGVPPKQFKAKRVAATLNALLASAEVARRCREIKARFAGVDPFRKACERIERLGTGTGQ